MDMIKLPEEQYRAVVGAVYELVDAVEEHQRAINFEDEGSDWEKRCDEAVDICLNRIWTLLKGHQIVYVIVDKEVYEGCLSWSVRDDDPVVVYEAHGVLRCTQTKDYYHTKFEAEEALLERQNKRI